MSLDRSSFLDLGTHCSLPSCHQLDFLPFKCPSCALPYCGEHWKPDGGHVCVKYDPATADNRIPSCPLCSTPISIPTGTDPNLTMDTHLSTTCPTLHPHLKPPKAANICAERKCKTKMIVPIQCDACKAKFCAKHRFGGDHACTGKPAPSGGAVGGKSKMGLSGLAALRRAQEAIKPSTNTSNARSPIPLGRKGNPIVISDSEPSSGADSDIEIVEPKKGASKGASTAKGVKVMASVGVGRKVDKRAVAEQESQRKGLEARAKKGLLSEDEKVRYATLKALDHKKGGKNGEGCRVA